MLKKPVLKEAEVKKMVREWYQKLDVHAPMVELLPMLAAKGLVMKFPEATLKSLAEFEGWFQRVIRIFFDEVHTVKKSAVKIKGNQAKVDVIVKWEASVWNPPDRLSKRIKADAYQTWIVKLSPTTGKPVIASYSVDKLKYYPGSAKL